MYRPLSVALSLLSLTTGLPSSLRVRDDNPGCQAASFGGFNWTIESFDYHASYIFTTPAHQNSWGYVNFNVTNPALLYKGECSASSNQLSDFFYGTMNYQCKFPEGAQSSGSFAFSRPSGKLDLNQTWTCSDTDPQYPTTVNAYGTTNLTLSCSDQTWTNPNWTIGQIYTSRTVTCEPQTFTLKPYQMTAVA